MDEVSGEERDNIRQGDRVLKPEERLKAQDDALEAMRERYQDREDILAILNWDPISAILDPTVLSDGRTYLSGSKSVTPDGIEITINRAIHSEFVEPGEVAETGIRLRRPTLATYVGKRGPVSEYVIYKKGDAIPVPDTLYSRGTLTFARSLPGTK